MISASQAYGRPAALQSANEQSSFEMDRGDGRAGLPSERPSFFEIRFGRHAVRVRDPEHGAADRAALGVSILATIASSKTIRTRPDAGRVPSDAAHAAARHGPRTRGPRLLGGSLQELDAGRLPPSLALSSHRGNDPPNKRIVAAKKGVRMSATLSYEDAVDLLDADHKLVQKMFLDYQGLCDDGAPSEAKRQLALTICQHLNVHTQIEEEIFYPRVRAAIKDDSLMEEAVREHAEAKKMISRIQGMAPADAEYDDTVKQLFTTVMDHVMDEREQMFLKARYSTVDLRGMVPELHARKKQLQTGAPAPAPAGKKKAAS
jgi:hemerythrin superfamily protein